MRFGGTNCDRNRINIETDCCAAGDKSFQEKRAATDKGIKDRLTRKSVFGDQRPNNRRMEFRRISKQIMR